MDAHADNRMSSERPPMMHAETTTPSVPTVYTAGRADAVRGYKAEAVCVSVSGLYLYGVLRVPLPRVRSVI